MGPAASAGRFAGSWLVVFLAVIALVSFHFAAARTPAKLKPTNENAATAKPQPPRGTGILGRMGRSQKPKTPSQGPLLAAVEETLKKPGSSSSRRTATRPETAPPLLFGNGIFSNTPSNSEMLLQQLSVKAQSKGMTTEQMIEKLIIPSKEKPMTMPSQRTSRSMPLPPLPVFEDAVEVIEREACADVPVSVEGVCIEKHIHQHEEACPIDHYKETCQLVTKTHDSHCVVTKEQVVTHQCPKVRNRQLCYQHPRVVEKVCRGFVIEARDRPCERILNEPVCHLADMNVQSMCLETKEVEKRYNCNKMETKLECMPDVVAIEQDCMREIKVPVVYDYVDMEPQRECEFVRKHVPEQCTKEVMAMEMYSCPEMFFDKECRMVEKPVQTMCDESKVITVERECFDDALPGAPRQISVKQKPRSRLRSLKEMHLPSPIYMTAPTPRSRSVRPPVNCGFEERVVVEQKPCTRMELTEECEVVERERPKMCEREVMRTVTEDCGTYIDEEVCIEVSKPVEHVGMRYETKLEKYDCTSTHTKEKCVEVLELVDSTCTAVLAETVEKPCTKTLREQVCDVVQVPELHSCVDFEEVEIDYPCHEIVFEEKCQSVPTYELEECQSVFPETVLEQCPKEHRVTECQVSSDPTMGICFRDEEVDVERPCFRIETKRTCQPAITTTMPFTENHHHHTGEVHFDPLRILSSDSAAKPAAADTKNESGSDKKKPKDKK